MIDKRLLEKALRQQCEGIQVILSSPCLPRFAGRHLSLERELLFLTGPRGTGKTTLGLKILSEGSAKFAYVDLSAIRIVRTDESSLNSLMEVLCIVYGDFEWIMLDEFLSVKDWQIIVRYFRTLGIKVLAVSSGTLNEESLPKSAVVQKLYPLSFSEYCLWHEVDTQPQNPRQMAALRLAFDDFSQRGGLPSVQFKSRTKGVVKKLFESILDCDIRGEFRKANLPDIKQMASYLSAMAPLSVFYNEIAEKFSLKSEITAKKYIGLIQNSALLYPLERFAFHNKMRDYGLREFNMDSSLCKPGDNEARLKTIVYMQLRRFCERHGYQMYYYGNRDLECDFVLCHEMKMRTIIQVIYDYSDNMAIKEKVASLISLSTASGCGKLFILTDNCHDTIETKGLSIFVKPAYEFLLDRSHMII